MVAIRIINRVSIYFIIICFSVVSAYCSISENLILEENSLDRRNETVFYKLDMNEGYFNTNVYYHIEPSLNNRNIIENEMIRRSGEEFHLFSHGRSGQLFLEGEWLDQYGIYKWIISNVDLTNQDNLNLYGCEFAKGELGRQAVSYLESSLGVSISASDDITGIDGDWELEVGRKYTLTPLDYPNNLQSIEPTNSAPQCFNCTPASWSQVGANSTTDISGNDYASETSSSQATPGYEGGGANWISGSLPSPPNSHTTWLSLRDLGSDAGNGQVEEQVETTVSGLEVGNTYKVYVYTLTDSTDNQGNSYIPQGAPIGPFDTPYAGTKINQYVYLVDQVETIVDYTNRNAKQWYTDVIEISATSTTHDLSFTADGDGSFVTPSNPWDESNNFNAVETIQISISEGAINCVPVAQNDNATTTCGSITIDALANDADSNNDMLNASTVDLHPGIAGIQHTHTIDGEGSYTVNDMGIVTFIPVSGFMGTSTIMYTVNDSYSLDGISLPETSNQASISVTVNCPCAMPSPTDLDTDGDGVPDSVDIDDDNDGIADVDECTLVEETSFANTDFDDDGGFSPVSGMDSSGRFATSSTSTATYTYENVRRAWGNGTGHRSRFYNSTGAGNNNVPNLGMVTYFEDDVTVSTDASYSFQNSQFEIIDLDSEDATFEVTLQDANGDNITGLAQADFVLTDASSLVTSYTVTEIPAGSGIYIVDMEASARGGSQKILVDADVAIYGYTFKMTDSVFNGEDLLFLLKRFFCVDRDTDGDTIPDHIDLDSDNDGIPDAIEGCGDETTTLTSDCRLEFDGTVVDVNNCPIGATTNACNVLTNSDTDDVPDYLDTDSDGDGCSDATEAGNGTTGVNDNTTNTYDDAINVDGNGLTSVGSPLNCGVPMSGDWQDDTMSTQCPDCPMPFPSDPDTDGDGVPDSVDVDDDNDGIADTDEKICFDSMVSSLNTPNYPIGTDLSANLPINDLFDGTMNFDAELFGTATWSNGVRIDNNATIGDHIYLQPSNAPNTGSDYVRYTISFETIVEDLTFVSAGLNNDDYFEFSAYRGGVLLPSSIIEFSNFDSNQSWDVQGPKVIGLGNIGGTNVDMANFTTYFSEPVDQIIIISGKDDNSTSTVTTALTTFTFCSFDDTDGDTVPDHIDLDSDNDGIPDAIEGCGDETTTLTADCRLPYDETQDTDIDGNGCPDGNVISPCSVLTNSDTDDVPDYIDTDSDSDGCSDATEAGNGTTGVNDNTTNTYDSAISVDANGLTDAAGAPGCGIPMNGDWQDDTAGNACINCPMPSPTDPDTDGDGVPDSVDVDDDNDGIPDSAECIQIPANIDGQVADAEQYILATGSVFIVGGNTNAAGYIESGFNGMMSTLGISTIGINDLTQNFANGTVTHIEDALNNNTDIGVSTVDGFISGNSGSGLSIDPPSAAAEADRDVIYSTFINFINPVSAVSFDLVDVFDHSYNNAGTLEHFRDTISIYADDILYGYIVSDETGITSSQTGLVSLYNADGVLITPSLTAGQNIEISIGLLFNNLVSNIEIRTHSIWPAVNSSNAGQSTRDWNGLDELYYSTETICQDTDGDDVPDFVDLDSDNDGIPDAIEGCGDETTTLTADCRLPYDEAQDTDIDGNSCPDGNVISPCTVLTNSDTDDVPDYLDTDSDGDGCSDATEAGNGTTGVNDNTTNTYDDALTVDGNGLTSVGTPPNCGVPMNGDWQDSASSACTTDAENDINQTPQDVDVSGNLLTNDVDDQGDTQTVTSITLPNGTVVPVPMGGSTGPQTIPGVGTIDVSSDGSYTFDPDPNFTGSVPSISYEIEDSTGATASATLDIDVIPSDDPATNEPPIANDDTNSTDQDVNVGGNLIDGNDSDPDTPQDDLEVTQIEIPDGMGGTTTVTVPENGSTGAQTIPGVGTIDVSSDGSYTFDPDPSFTGETPPIGYTISDGTSTDDATLVIDVNPDPNMDMNNTYANDDANVGPVDQPQSGNVIPNDNDPEGDTQTVSQVDTDGDGIPDAAPGGTITLPSGGTVTFNSDGSYDYQPAAGFIGTEQIVYEVSDGNGGTDTATLYLTTLPETDAENDINQTPQDVDVSGNLLTNDVDGQGDIQTVTSITLPNGTVVPVPMGGSTTPQTIAGIGTITVSSDGSYTFDPDPNFTGSVPSIGYEIEDSTGATASATLDIDVIPSDDPATNEPPIANDDTNSTDQDVNVGGNLIDGNDSDPDTPQDDLVVTEIEIPDGMGGTTTVTVPENGSTGAQTIPGVGTIDVSSDGSYTFDPDPSFTGETPPIGYTISDGTSTDDATLVIDVNPDPNMDMNNTYANDDANVGTVDQPQSGNVIPNDNDPEGDTQTVSQVDTDGDGIPDAAPGGTITLPSGGTVTFNSDGSYDYQPAAGFIGTEQIVYEVSDGNGGTDTATLYLTTLPETDAESDINQTPQDVDVSGNLLTNDVDGQGDIQTVTSITLPNGTIVPVPMGGSTAPQTIAGVGTITVSSDGSYTFDPDPNFTGSVPSIGYEIEDSTGATASATLDIDVIPSDDPATNEPPIANDDTNSTDQDVNVGGNLIDGNDSDLDTPQDDLVVTEIEIPNGMGGTTTVTIPSGGSTGPQTIPGVGTIDVSSDGSYTFDPDPSFTGETPPIGYTISDGTSTDDATLVIDVNPDPNMDMNNTYANDDANVGPVDQPQSGNVIPNDNDPEGDTQTVSQVDTDADGIPDAAPGGTITLPSGGTVTFNSDGSYDYQPAAGFIGTEQIVYEVSDGNGGTDTATLYLTTLPETDAENDINQTPQDVDVSGNLLTNDVDGQGDTQTVTSITLPNGTIVPVPMGGSTGSQTIPGVGTIDVSSDGSYTFDPDPNFTGSVPSISYEIEDSTGATASATLDIDVIPSDDPATNEPPIANDDTNSTDQDVNVGGNLIDGNDSDPDTPQDDLVVTEIEIPDGMGGTTTVTVPENGSTGAQTIPGVGTIDVSSDGSYTFDPDPSFTGETPPIGYTISDGTSTDDATLVIDVNPDVLPSDPDYATTNTNNTYGNDDANVGPVDQPQSENVITNDNDPEGDTQTVSQVDTDADGIPDAAPGGTITLPSGGTVTFNSDGSYDYQPAAGFIGTEQIVYEVSDGNGGTDTATLYLTTLPETDAENDINQTPQDVDVSGNLLTNDVDGQGDIQTVTSITLPNGTVIPVPMGGSTTPQTIAGIGTITVSSDGSYTFDPDPNFTGSVPSISYEIEDSTGATASATLDIDVIPSDDPATNEPPIANDDTNSTDQDVNVGGNLIDGNDSDLDTPQDDLEVTQIEIPDGMGGTTTVTIPSGGSTGPQTIPGVGTIDVSSDGSYTFDPDPSFTGETPPIGYTISDGTSTDDATLVIDVNQDVLPTDPDYATTNTNNTYGNDDATLGPQDLPQSINLLDNDNDPEMQDQDIQSVTVLNMNGEVVVVTDFTSPIDVYLDDDGDPNTAPILAGQITALDAETGDITFNPVPNFIRTAPIVYTVVDESGATDTATYYPTTLPVNTTIAENDINQTPQDIPVGGNVLTNDSDDQGDVQEITELNGMPLNDSPITISVSGVDEQGNTVADAGMITINPDGSYDYVPASGFTGTVTVPYIVTDDNESPSTDMANLVIDVVGPDANNNIPPIAIDDNSTTAINTTVNIPVLGNDSDPDGMMNPTTLDLDPSMPGIQTTITTPEGNYTMNADNTVNFDPATDFVGETTPLPYTICDDTSPTPLCDDATITVVITDDPNNEMTADDDANSGIAGATLTGDILDNDNDPDGSTGTPAVQGAQAPINADGSSGALVLGGPAVTVYGEDPNNPGSFIPAGTLVLNADGSYTYVSDADFVGTISVPYSVCDEDDVNACDDATLVLTSVPEVVDLPIELYSFRVSKQGENSLLNWITLSELNNEYFNIERSLDGVNFEIIGRVEGSGTTLDKQEYFFTDDEVERGINYYRLNQFDFDGKSSYSPIRTLRFVSSTELSFNLYPNPLYDKVVITSNVEVQDYKFKVFNAVGQVMRSGIYKAGMELDMTGFEPGVYIFNIVDKDGILVNNYRLVKL